MLFFFLLWLWLGSLPWWLGPVEEEEEEEEKEDEMMGKCDSNKQKNSTLYIEFSSSAYLLV